MDDSKKMWLLIPLVVILTAGVAGGGAWYYLDQKNDKEVKDLNAKITALNGTVSSSASSSVAADEIAGWKNYENTAMALSFKLPIDWKYTESTADGNLSSFNILSPEKLAARENQAASGSKIDTVYYNLLVRCYPQISDMYGGLGGNKPKNLDELVAVNSYISNVTKTTFLGEVAYEGTRLGEVGAYAIVVAKENHVFELISFESENKSGLSNTLSLILKNMNYAQISNDPHYIVGWKQYTNTVHKYSTYFPKDYIATEGSTDSNMAFSTEKDGKALFNISVSTNTNNKTLEAAVKDIVDRKIATSDTGAKSTITDIKLDDVSAKKYSIAGYGDIGNAGAVVISNGNIYHLSGFDQNFTGASVLTNVLQSFNLE